MKKIILSVFVFILMIGNMYARGNTDAQKLGSPTPLQQIINAMPAIPIPLIGKNMKFQFGGDKWIAKINEENFLAGDCIFEENGNGYILTLNTTNVWTGAVEEVIDLLQKTGIPLGPAEGPLRTAAKLAAKLAKWIPLKGSAIVLEYKEGPPVNISFIKMDKQKENTQTPKMASSVNTQDSITQSHTGKQQTRQDSITRGHTGKQPTRGETFFVNTQGLITLRDGSIIETKIIQMSPEFLIYQHHEYGPAFLLQHIRIHSIEYENGDMDIFNPLLTDKELSSHSYMAKYYGF